MKKNTMISAGAGLAVAAGLALGGAALANANETPAATTASGYGTTAPGQGGEGQQGQGRAPGNSNGNTDPSKPMRSDEQLLTGDIAAKVTAAAKAKEPTATIERVESDSDGVYEAHMVRADGTHIIVQVGADFAVTNLIEGGAGGPGQGGKGGGGQPPSGGQQGEQAPSTSGSSTTS